MLNYTDLAGAIAQSVVVMVLMMIGSAIGEEVAGFFFQRVKGGILQVIYFLFYMPMFIVGGYVYTLLKIPSTSIVSTALYFALWGVFTVFVSRLFITAVGKVFGIRLSKPKGTYINGKDLIKFLKAKNMPENEIRKVLVSSSESKAKASKLMDGGPEWIDIDPEALCYELAKRGYGVHDVMDALKTVLRMKPEDAAVVWKNASV